MDNLGEIEKFLERYNLPSLNQEETENMKRPITTVGVETVIKNSQQTKVQDQTASQVSEGESCSVVSDSLWPQGLYSS